MNVYLGNIYISAWSDFKYGHQVAIFCGLQVAILKIGLNLRANGCS
jgi:hypothetical protein